MPVITVHIKYHKVSM